MDYACQLCDATFELSEDAGTARPPFPTDWKLWLVHDHEGLEAPIWRAVLFHHSARERYPVEAKEIKAAQASQRKAVVKAKQAQNASRGENDHTVG
jgi:hypothetical protein